MILPVRPFRSARQYASIWTPQGSPLLVHGRALAEGLAKRLGDAFHVELAMRYGQPSIASALDALERAGAERVHILPLFPHYAASSSGSALERVFRLAGSRWNVPALDVLPPFYDDPGYIEAVAAVARPHLAEAPPDHVLFSYHGLPESHVQRAAPDADCVSDRCCDAIVAANRWCYRAQCYATTRALAAALELAPDRHSTAFQSRLAPQRWIEPYTDVVLPQLHARGVRRLAVACPAFVADNLETLEEVGVRAREQWSELGGEHLELIPCVNARPEWIETIAGWMETRA